MLRCRTTILQKLASTARRKPERGVTLIELLCVMVIIAILFSMLMPSLMKAYRRAKAMSEEWDEEAVASMLVHEVRGYCSTHPAYQFDSKGDFADKCSLNPKCRDWINTSHTEFVPFNNLDPTNKIVVTFHYGRNYSQTDYFSKGHLTLPPPER